MTDRHRILIFASAATLALALAQPAAAEDDTAAPAASAPEAPAATAEAPAAPAPAPAAEEAAAPEAAPAVPPPPSATAEPSLPPDIAAAHAEAMKEMEKEIEEMNAERNKRYAELREQAAEVGLELPETPPWEEAGMPPMPSEMGMPPMPSMPSDVEARYKLMRERAAARGIDMPETPPYKLMTSAERRAEWERMRKMTPEERAAARKEAYNKLRERAAAKGIDMPETPPWEQAEQRRKAMMEKWESYRKEVDAMTDAQREAAEAIFSARPAPEMPEMPEMPMQRSMPMDMPMPGRGGYGPGPCYQSDCMNMMGPRGPMPGWGNDQAPPPPQGGYGSPWGRGNY